MSSVKCFRVFLLLSLLISGACSTTGRDSIARYSPQQLQQMGEKFLAAGDTAQALKCLTQAAKKRPSDPWIQYYLGLAYNHRGMQNEAVAHFNKALALKPDFSEAQNALGALYAEQGRIDMAQLCFEKALANPFYETPHYVHYNLGRLYERKGDQEAALKEYREAVRLFPAYGQAYFRMGQILEGMKRGDEARRCYGKATEFAPDLVEAHLRYGIMSYLAGDLEPALYSLNRVTRLDPHSANAEEAAKYLQRLQTLMHSKEAASTSSAVESLHRVEVISPPDIQRMEALPDQADASANPPYSMERKSVPPGLSEQTGPAGPEKPSQPGQQWDYIVQVGSFFDKEVAEKMEEKLKSRGFGAIVRPVRHQVLGPIYVVQLNPVDSLDKANTLMTQLGKELKGTPVIIKVPASF